MNLGPPDILMHLFRDLLLLLLLSIANSMPIVARHLFKNRFENPVDFNINFIDGRPLLGPHKTWRGILASIVGTSIAAVIFGFGLITGMKLAFFSMIGDLISSFIKRRCGLESGARFTGLDQGIEAGLPLLVLWDELGIFWWDIILITGLFTFFSITLSPFFYRIGFRRHPY